jgi:hypothetical protein
MFGHDDPHAKAHEQESSALGAVDWRNPISAESIAQSAFRKRGIEWLLSDGACAIDVYSPRSASSHAMIDTGK